MKTLTFPLLLVAATLRAQQPPQAPRLLADLGTSPAQPSSSQPDQFTAVGALTYFVAGTGATGRELYRSLGSRGSTMLVSDLAVGSASSDPNGLTAVGGQLFFFANDQLHGNELHVSDGSVAGTRLVADLSPGAESSELRPGFAVNDRFVFGRADAATGLEPWVSDGTTAGTRLLFDVHAGPGSAFSEQELIPGGVARDAMGHERLVFVALVQDRLELWSTDGTTSGTARIESVRPGFSQLLGWSAGQMVDGRLVVVVEVESQAGLRWSKVFVTDGSASATHVLFDDTNFTERPLGETMHRFADRMALVRQDALMLIGGEPLGVSLIAVPPGLLQVRVLHEVGDALYVSAWNVGFPLRPILFRLDVASSTLVQVGGPSFVTGPHSNDPSRGTVVQGGRILTTGLGYSAALRAVDVSTGQVESLVPTPPTRLVRSAGRVFLAMSDPELGVEPATSDGTRGGTRVLVDISVSTGGQQTESSTTSRYFPVGDRVVFSAHTERQGGVYVYDGTTGGTSQILSLPPQPFLRGLFDAVEIDGVIWMNILNRLWSSDGTATGTIQVGAADPLVVQSDLLPFGDAVVFFGSRSLLSGVFAARPGSVDLLLAVDLGGVSQRIERIGDRLVAIIHRAVNIELWNVDLRAGTSQQIATVPRAPGGRDVVTARDRLWFAGLDGNGRTALWSTDGSRLGTLVEHRFTVGAEVRNLAASREDLWLITSTQIVALNLSERVTRSIPYQATSAQSREIAILGDRLLYTEPESSTRSTILSTDGTSAGTRVLGSAPATAGLQAAGGRLVIATGIDASGSSNLLVTDGTPGGTRLLSSMEPDFGMFRAGPSDRVMMAGQVFLTLFDPSFGFEPHVIDVGAAFEASVDACGGGAGGRAASLSLDGALELGTRREFRVRSAAGSVGFLLLGLDPGRSIPFVAAGMCQLAVDPSTAFVSAPLAMVARQASMLLDVPDLALLDGVLLSAQAVIGGTDAVLGFDLSNGLAMSVGR